MRVSWPLRWSSGKYSEDRLNFATRQGVLAADERTIIEDAHRTLPNLDVNCVRFLRGASHGVCDDIVAIDKRPRLGVRESSAPS